MGDAIQADDFILSLTSDLTAVRFWTLEADGAYLGSVTWSINNDAGSEPGAAVGSGNLAPVRTNVGSALGLNVFQNDFLIGISNLSAGTYWLLLHDGAASAVDFQDMYWAHADLNATNTSTTRGVEQNLPGGTTWNDVSQEHAFLIQGDLSSTTPIPEPATVSLIGAGILGLFLTRRNRQATGNQK